MDIKYNYLINDSKDNFPDDFNVDERIDPDSCSKELYDDIISVFFSQTEDVINWEQQNKLNPKFYTIKYSKDILLSSDYIGPSVFWAREVGISEETIRKFLKSARTIGGHIVWQRGSNLKYKVNTARGGSSGVYDRFDWTLLLLKIYLCMNIKKKDTFLNQSNELLPNENRNNKNVNDKFAKMYYAFENSSWLKTYTFKNFCTKFKLYGNFVDSQYDVVEMAPLFPILPKDYKLYIDNVCRSIDIRNAMISKI